MWFVEVLPAGVHEVGLVIGFLVFEPVVLLEPGLGGGGLVVFVFFGEFAALAGFGVGFFRAEVGDVACHAFDAVGAAFLLWQVGGREIAEGWARGEEGEEVWREFVGHGCWGMYVKMGGRAASLVGRVVVLWK